MRNRPHRATRAEASRPRPARRRLGFSLVELLASICILMIIVSLLAILFRESDRAWHIGTGRTSNNIEGRAAIDMITHDLQYAVADDVLTFVLRQDRNKIKTYDFDNDEICFVSIQHNSSGAAPRAVREVTYYLKEMLPDAPGRFQLQRAYFSKEIADDPNNHCYHKKDWYAVRPSFSQPIAENIAGLAFFWSGSDTSREYNSVNHTNQLPTYVDVYLEVLNERDAKRLVEMQARGIDPRDFVERNARRYTTRVQFLNRNGYMPR
jgi:hypothetical protein